MRHAEFVYDNLRWNYNIDDDKINVFNQYIDDIDKDYEVPYSDYIDLINIVKETSEYKGFIDKLNLYAVMYTECPYEYRLEYNIKTKKVFFEAIINSTDEVRAVDSDVQSLSVVS